MTRAEADALLTGAELTPCGEGPLAAARRLVEACLEAEIPAAMEAIGTHGACGCGKGGCGGGNVRVVVRADDAPRVGELLRIEWLEAVRREGTEFTVFQATEDGEPPCPACGTAAPLVDGACSDCGLQLE